VYEDHNIYTIKIKLKQNPKE